MVIHLLSSKERKREGRTIIASVFIMKTQLLRVDSSLSQRRGKKKRIIPYTFNELKVRV